MEFETIKNTIVTTVTNVGLQVIGAIVLWIVGRTLINFAISLVGKSLNCAESRYNGQWLCEINP